MKESHSKFSKNESVCMCKEDWYVRLGQEGDCLREDGGTVLNALKRGGIEKRGGETKNYKKGQQARSRSGCLKKGGWNPLTNYEIMAW